jgi:hypothetical protein
MQTNTNTNLVMQIKAFKQINKQSKQYKIIQIRLYIPVYMKYKVSNYSKTNKYINMQAKVS